MIGSDCFFVDHGRKLFEYDPDAGSFRRLPAPRDLFGSDYSYRSWLAQFDPNRGPFLYGRGYHAFRFRSHRIMAHRLAWILQTGKAPSQHIDHLNGDRTDNRWCNIREADHSLNRMNQRRRGDNTSGVTGVVFDRRKAKWVAQICVRGKRKQLGSFAKKSDAVAARLAAQSAHDFGPNHGATL